MSTTIAERLQAAEIVLPEAAAPAANYVPTLLFNGVLHVSGQLPMENGAVAVTGKAGQDLTVVEAQRAARLCAINILAQAQSALGSLDRIEQVLRLNGFVNATPEFGEHPAVINGASDLIATILGDAGQHTRIAVGVASLPFGAAVEVDATLAVKPG